MEETGLPHFSEEITMHSLHKKTVRNYRQLSVQLFWQLSIHLILTYYRFFHVTEAVHFPLYHLIDSGVSYLVFSELEGSDQH